MNRNPSHEIPVVFAHLGEAPAPWLLWNIDGLRSIWPNQVVLVSDQAHLLREAELLGADGIIWKPDPRTIAKYQRVGQSRRRFWNGFWLYTALRFDAVRQAHEMLSPGGLVHLESDVVLHPSKGLAWTDQLSDGVALSRLGPGRSGGAVVFSSSPKDSHALCESVNATFELDPTVNEMQALDVLRTSHPAIWTTLPTAPSANRAHFQGEVADSDRKEMSEGATRFGGLFDVAGVGQYLLGTDPRGRRGVSRLYRTFPDQYIAVDRWTFAIDEWGWPSVVSEDESSLPMLSLHNHAKDRRAFLPKKLPALMKRRMPGSQYRIPVRIDGQAVGWLLGQKFARIRSQIIATANPSDQNRDEYKS